MTGDSLWTRKSIGKHIISIKFTNNYTFEDETYKIDK